MTHQIQHVLLNSTKNETIVVYENLYFNKVFRKVKVSINHRTCSEAYFSGEEKVK